MKKIAALALSLASSFAIYGSAEAAPLIRLTDNPISIPEDYKAEVAATKFKASGPALLFSDSPEMVYHNGILYRDVVQSRVRLFFHHVNAVSGLKKLGIILKNDKMRPVHYRIVQQGIAGPGYNYMEVGKESQRLYFMDDGNQYAAASLGFGRSVELLSGQGTLLPQNTLLTGTLDLELDGPAQLSVIMCEPKTDLVLFNDNASIEPMDEHPLRGTFSKSDWEYTIKKPLDGKRPVKLKLASSEQGYSKGVDATTGLAAENYGNYGIVYKVNFTVASERSLSFILNPIGGYFAGYGILQGEGEQRLIALPKYDLCLGETIEEAVELGRLKQGRYSFIWSPPGASNLPIELIWRTSSGRIRR